MMSRSSQLARAAINGIAVALPEQTLSNETMMADTDERTRALLLRHTGVLCRHIAAEGETALDLGERACRKLFDAHPDLAARVDTLIFCTQSPDYILPPNSCVLHGRLGLRDDVAAFDLPHACSGFVYAIKLAQALIASGAAENVLVVTADTYSRFIHPQDRSTRLLFGDGAAATWIGAATEGRGVLDVSCGTDGKRHGKFFIPAGGTRMPVTDAVRREEKRDSSGNLRSPAHIHMAGNDMLSFVGSRIPGHVTDLLARNALALDAVDWLVFHQASSVVLDTLTNLLDADPAKVLRHFQSIGNTVSASIPIVLDHAIGEGIIKPGQLVLLCGFGVGLSWGSALVRW